MFFSLSERAHLAHVFPRVYSPWSQSKHVGSMKICSGRPRSELGTTEERRQKREREGERERERERKREKVRERKRKGEKTNI